MKKLDYIMLVYKETLMFNPNDFVIRYIDEHLFCYCMLQFIVYSKPEYMVFGRRTIVSRCITRYGIQLHYYKTQFNIIYFNIIYIMNLRSGMV